MTRRWPILAIFVVSGAAGLIYEVVWARQLVLVFGNTTQAVSAILTGFFGGMAIGSVFGGRLGDRVRRPLRMYGLLELILVVIVLATPITFRLLHEVYRGAFGSLEGAPVALALVRFVLALIALGPATILMGATLPTLTRYLSRDPAQLSLAFGRLYAANTVGAIIGTIAAGFILIELLGLTGTLLVGAACSATAGVIALVIDRSRGPLPAADGPAASPGPVSPPPAGEGGPGHSPTVGSVRPQVRLALGIAFVSGLTSLAYQSLWTRLLASGTGNSTYVFTAILAVFLIGLAGGALAFAVLRSRIKNTMGVLALGQVLVAGLVVVGTVVILDRQFGGPLVLTAHFEQLATDFLWPVVIVVLPATFVMGFTFPAASALVADPDGHVATNAGLLLSANTLGAICGTFLVPFVAIPILGSPMTLAIVALLNAAVGLYLAQRGRSGWPLSRLAASAGVAVAVVVILVALIARTVFVDPSVARIARSGEVFSSREDEIASVQAGEINGVRQLWVTGTSMTLLTVDAKLMPILPLMLRPASATELTIAFGMGSAFRAALNAGLKADVVELVPSVPDMFGSFYPDAQKVLADPNGHVIIADGRNHVELTDKTYDIVIVDPPPPIESAGVSVISSLEFYEAAKARLTPGGVMMQWIPYGQSLDEFKAHVRTYNTAFPHVIIAFGPGGYGFFMLGSTDPIAFDPASIQAVLARPNVVADLSSAYDSPEHTEAGWATRVMKQIWIQGGQVAAFAGAGPLVTDDRPLPEYFLLRHLFGTPSPGVSPSLLLQLSAALPKSP